MSTNEKKNGEYFKISGEEKSDEKREKYERAIRYLSSYKDKPADAANDQNLKLVLKVLTEFHVSFDKFQAELQDLFYETITKLIETECSAIMNQTKQIEKEKHIKLLKTYLDVLNSYTFKTESFKLRFKKQDACIKTLLELSKNLSDDYHSSKLDYINKVLAQILQLILNLTESNYRYEKDWKDQNLLEALLFIGNMYEDEKVKRLCAKIVLNVFDYAEESKLNVDNDYFKIELVVEEDDSQQKEADTDAVEKNNDKKKKEEEVEDEVKEEESASEKKESKEDAPASEIDPKIHEAIKLLSEYTDIKNMIRDHRCLQAFNYIWYFINNAEDSDEIKKKVYDEIFKAPFLKLMLEFLKTRYDDLAESSKVFDADTETVPNETHYKMIKYLLYMDLIIEKLITPNLAFETTLKFIEINGVVDFVLKVLKNKEMTEVIIKNRNTVMNYVYMELFGAIIHIFQRLVTVSDMYKELFKSLDNATLFEITEIARKLEMSSSLIVAIPALLEYPDDEDENQLILLKQYNKSKYNPECEESFEIYKNSIKYLTESFTPEQTLDSRKAIDLLDYHYFAKTTDYEKLNDDLKFKYVKFIISYIKFEHATLIKELKAMKFDPKKQMFDKVDLKIIKLTTQLDNVLVVCLSLANIYTEFCKLFHEADENSIAIMFKFINDEFLLSLILNEKSNSVISFIANYPFRSALGFLHNLSQVANVFREKWTQVNAYKVLLNLGNKLSQLNNDFRLVCFMALANCATEDDLTNFTSSISVLDLLIDTLKSFASVLVDEPDEIVRETFQVDVNDKEKLEMIVCGVWRFSEIIHALYQFAINDSIKPLLYFNLSAKEYLLKIIYNGNEIEQEYAIKLLNQLCFDKKVAQDVVKDKELMDFLKDKLEKKTEKTRKKLAKYIEAILWLIEQDHKPSGAGNKTSKDGAKQIMISYNSESRQYCLDLKKYLESIGYKVWIDVENIHGSSIDAMANAVESSWVVLICMTEKYKDSANCRLEAEYVAQLKKPFIPLIMQKSYKPRGWLGMLLGAKIFIDFTKYDFSECVTRVRKELMAFEEPGAITQPCAAAPAPIEPPVVKEVEKTREVHVEKKIENEQQIVAVNEPIEKPIERVYRSNTVIKRNHAALQWRNTDVENWFNEKGINSSIKDYFSSFDGKHLLHLHKIYAESPDFFYRTLRMDTNAKLRDIAIFTEELNSLFSK